MYHKKHWRNLEMKTVTVKKIEAYMWECPECGYFNIGDKDVKVLCDECDGEFIPKEKIEEVDI